MTRGPSARGDNLLAPARERSSVIDRLECIITRDLGGRGLAADPQDNLVTRCRGNLARAARHMADEGSAVAIVTGFHVAAAERPTIETDGPCGAVALGWLLARIGFEVVLVTDPLGAEALSAAMRAARLEPPSVTIQVFPFENESPTSLERCSNLPEHSAQSQLYAESFFRSPLGGRLTHLVAVERAGPGFGTHVDRLQEPGFAERSPVGPRHDGRVHNFRGMDITPFTAKAHLLFDFVRDNHLPIRTIGIGDGGNEIGMGSIPRAVLKANIPGNLGELIACRVATDWTIACGVSNWGAYALGTAVAWHRGLGGVLGEWTDAREQAVLEALVERGAVDGVTGKADLSVDGMPLIQHLEIWAQIREAVAERNSHASLQQPPPPGQAR